MCECMCVEKKMMMMMMGEMGGDFFNCSYPNDAIPGNMFGWGSAGGR